MPLDPVYTRLMSKSQMTSSTSFAPRAFALEFDICTVGYDNVWDAHAAMVKVGRLHPMLDVVSVSTWGTAPNGWPILSIVFASLDAAKAYTFVYLGYDENTTVPDVYTDEEVGEYISFGKFVD